MDREVLRATFDRAAASYHRARPDYPDEIFDMLIDLAGLRTGDHLLEVGCGTGKATLPLARRGYRITCLELGAHLAEEARRNLAGFDEVTVVRASFEDWDRPADVVFDLVFAATAWHWIDPQVRYVKAWEALRPGGHLAFWSALHVFPEGGDPFFGELDEIYQELGEGGPPDAARPRPGELRDERAEVVASGLFDSVGIRHVDWEVTYDADGYLDLLDTFSGHVAMPAWRRQRLHDEIRRRLADRPDGLVRRHWGAALHVARRLDQPAPPTPNA